MIDCGSLVLMPGIVDSHVHVNEPGRRTEWEGFQTATAAAAAGGITTIVDMPVSSHDLQGDKITCTGPEIITCYGLREIG